MFERFDNLKLFHHEESSIASWSCSSSLYQIHTWKLSVNGKIFAHRKIKSGRKSLVKKKNKQNKQKKTQAQRRKKEYHFGVALVVCEPLWAKISHVILGGIQPLRANLYGIYIWPTFVKFRQNILGIVTNERVSGNFDIWNICPVVFIYATWLTYF